ncbi:MAG TPA: hypothetical protein VK615_15545 [Candidatus Binatia bacterium]|nr:hypothetical protein [Candidatus Binatia bacterium]
MKTKKFRVKWGDDALKTEDLKWRTDPRDFDRLCNYAVGEITAKVVGPDELREIATSEEIRHHVREAAERYDPEKFGNLGWYVYTRLKFLVMKWRRQTKNAGSKFGRNTK